MRRARRRLWIWLVVIVLVPPVVPLRPVPIWPPPAAAPAGAPPAPAPDLSRLWWMMAIGMGSAAVAGASSVLAVMSLMKLYRARTRRVRIVATPPGEAPIDV